MRTAAVIFLLTVWSAPTLSAADDASTEIARVGSNPAPALPASPELQVAWTSSRDGWGDLLHGEFVVGNAGCAYSSMADAETMKQLFEHLTRVDTHVEEDGFQDLTFFEEFVFVGMTESRYHRTLDGVGRIEWKLISGRAAKHDGWWQVYPDGRVVVENLIQAKHRVQQPVVSRVQTRTMGAIVRAIAEVCR